VLVDDHDLVRLLLRRSVADHAGLRVVGEASDADAGVALVARVRPDVVVLDIGLAGMEGLDAAGAIREQVPTCGIVVFSAFEADRYGARALLAGADVYVEKRAGFQAAVLAIAAVAGR
jgi:DNA-binding NarL/FixJ family response regulator